MAIKLNVFKALSANDVIEEIDIFQLYQRILNPTTKAAQFKADYLRLISNNLQLDLLDQKDLEERKVHTLQCTCIPATYPEKTKQKGSKYEYTQLIYLDYDKKDNPTFDSDQLEYLKSEIIKIDFVKIVSTSTRGEGLAVIVEAEGIDSKEKYQGTLEAAAEIIAKKVDNSLVSDKNAQSDTKLWIIPSDTTARYNRGTFKLKARVSKEQALTKTPKQKPAVNIVSFSASFPSSAPYCNYLKPLPKDRFRLRIYGNDIIDGYKKTPSGSVYVKDGFYAPIKPYWLGREKWKTGERAKKLYRHLNAILMINKGITKKGFENLLNVLHERFEEKWSIQELYSRGYQIWHDFEAGKYDPMYQINGELINVRLQNRFYSKEVIEQKSIRARMNEDNFILQKFIYSKQSIMFIDIVEEMIQMDEYKLRKITIDELAERTATDKRRIIKLIETTPKLKALIEEQNKSAYFTRKDAFDNFTNIADALNEGAKMQEVIDTFGISRRTYFGYLNKYKEIKGLRDY